MRDIRKLIDEEGINQRRFASVEYKDAKGEMRPMYQLDFQATMILITGYDAKRRAVVIDRWLQLETGQAKPAAAEPTAEPEVDLDFTREGELMVREIQLGMRLAMTIGFRGQVMFSRSRAIVRQRTGVDFMDYFGLRQEDLAGTKYIPESATRKISAGEELAPVLDEFLGDCCHLADGKRVQAGMLYKRFISWLDDKSAMTGSPLSFRPSKKAFGMAICRSFGKIKSGGMKHYTGLDLLESEKEVLA